MIFIWSHPSPRLMSSLGQTCVSLRTTLCAARPFGLTTWSRDCYYRLSMHPV